MAALFRTAELADVDRGAAELPPLMALILSRIAIERGATHAEILRDIGRLTSHKFSPGEWRQFAEKILLELQDADLISRKRTRYLASDSGRAALTRFLGINSEDGALTWPEQRDTYLTARALGISNFTPTTLKSLKKPDGLRTLIVQHAFSLPLDGTQSAQDLRESLTVIALSRAFGNKVKSGLGKSKDFSAKAGRLLAGQLSRRPRDFGTDAKLIAGLAAEAVDAPQSDADPLRLAILRRYTQQKLSDDTGTKTDNLSADEDKKSAANNVGKKNVALQQRRKIERLSADAERPDMVRFASCVQEAARKFAEGWPGNQKAFISHVWQAIRDSHAAWGISEIEFKCMLAEAHRAGHVVLANADIKDKSNIAEIEASAISYKNTVWHLVRVSEEA